MYVKFFKYVISNKKFISALLINTKLFSCAGRFSNFKYAWKKEKDFIKYLFIHSLTKFYLKKLSTYYITLYLVYCLFKEVCLFHIVLVLRDNN